MAPKELPEIYIHLVGSSAGGDGGGIGFVNGHLVRIPPWNPEVLAAVLAANALANYAHSAPNKALGQEAMALANRIAEPVMSHLQQGGVEGRGG